IADWSNPIIQHGEVDFRDPRRDHEHGRIWRVSAKGRPVAEPANLPKASVGRLLDATLSQSGWEQEQGRRMAALKLAADRTGKAWSIVREWAVAQKDGRAFLEALWMDEGLRIADDLVVEKVVTSANPHYRAAGARYLANNPGVNRAAERLAKLVAD